MIVQGAVDTLADGVTALRLKYDAGDGSYSVYRVWVDGPEGLIRIEISGLAEGHYYGKYIEDLVMDIANSLEFRQPSGSLALDELGDKVWISGPGEPGILMTNANTERVIRTVHLYRNGRYAGWNDRAVAQPDSSTAIIRGKWSIRATPNITEVVFDHGDMKDSVEYSKSKGGALFGIQQWTSRPLEEVNH